MLFSTINSPLLSPFISLGGQNAVTLSTHRWTCFRNITAFCPPREVDNVTGAGCAAAIAPPPTRCRSALMCRYTPGASRRQPPYIYVRVRPHALAPRVTPTALFYLFRKQFRIPQRKLNECLSQTRIRTCIRCCCSASRPVILFSRRSRYNTNTYSKRLVAKSSRARCR